MTFGSGLVCYSEPPRRKFSRAYSLHHCPPTSEDGLRSDCSTRRPHPRHSQARIDTSQYPGTSLEPNSGCEAKWRYPRTALLQNYWAYANKFVPYIFNNIDEFKL